MIVDGDDSRCRARAMAEQCQVEGGVDPIPVGGSLRPLLVASTTRRRIFADKSVWFDDAT